ncbi:hypothetical protein F5X99DRAFT_373939 [Biscogniauxia marginata]|nr:hypothetical protein F5X99DRAFT_373939 [Biscogniauxia marginata]
MQALSWLAALLSVREAASLKLNVTAVGARDGSSTLECWQMDEPFNPSAGPGKAGSPQVMLGDVTTLSYTIVPADFDGGLHNAPRNQWVAITSGLAYFTLPDDDTTSAYVSGGQFGLIFASDTAEVSLKGHRTQFPGTTETTVLLIPTYDNKIPDHHVLHMGPCGISEIAGMREAALADTTSEPADSDTKAQADDLPHLELR